VGTAQLRHCPPDYDMRAQAAQSHAIGVSVPDDLEAWSRPHVQSIVDFVERYGHFQRRKRDIRVELFDRFLGPGSVVLPSVNRHEGDFRLDLQDRVDTFHTLVLAQFGAVVEDGGPDEDTSTTIVGLEAVRAVALGGPQSTTTSGYRTVSGPVCTAVSLDVVRHPLRFPAGTRAVRTLLQMTLCPSLAPAMA
jgi:hypothetical protein